MHDRLLEYERVFNLRDLGGYETRDGRTVRWRTVFRGDGVHRLDPEVFRELDVRTVLDLRTEAEIESRGRADGDLDWHHLPMIRTIWEPSWFTEELTAERFLADRYLDMLDEGAASLAGALRILGQPERIPAVFHCAAGKDRTGVVAAVVLALLGVDDDAIAIDYGLSRLGMARMIEYVRATYPEWSDTMTHQPTAFYEAPEPAMLLFLADLRRRFGSVDDYAASIGVGPAIVDALRTNLLV